ncbi:hypothetical protein GGR57DRAFT_508132 [Xylariaceae sp. FL1272]|nr:hypothetical protein GGR57DRAFT_508132 [Xylariaceae sp. FL1272]
MTTSIQILPANLSPLLSPREAIADALYRCFAGLDTPDLALWESSFTRDAQCTVDGRKIVGMEEITAQVYEPTSKLDTTHFVTNTLAQHYRSGTGREPGATSLLAGGPYFIQLVKDADGGLWRMKTFEMSPRWTQGDMTVLSG